MRDFFSLSVNELTNKKIIDWGYTEELTPKSYDRYLEWVNKDLHGPLNYLADERKLKRETLKNVFPECESAVVFLFQYIDLKKTLMESNSEFKIASYTIGFEDQDYHYWIKARLTEIGDKLKIQFPTLEYKISLDVHPVLERDLAYRSGLGWFGKNSMLINQENGSYTLIGSLLLNQKLEIETNHSLATDHCGSCTRCVDACPTNAIDGEMRVIESKKCISTFTIEQFKDGPAPSGFPVESKEVFGCDICQEVCPWNNKPLAKAIPEDSASELVVFFNRDIELIFNDISSMSNNQYKRFFKGTSFERSGKRGLLKNLKLYLDQLL